MADEAILKVGVAGLGFGCTEFMPTLERLPQIEIVAAADIRQRPLDVFESRYGGRGYLTVEELCADPDVEAVWISTPNQFHAEHAITAAEHGKHILLRKPMGITMEECQRVLDAVERNGVKLLAGGQTQGTNPLTQALRAVIVSGELGELRAINIWAYTGWMLSPRMPQEVDESSGGGVIWRQAPHQLETIRYLGGGMVRSVRATTGRWRPERPNASAYYAAHIEFEDGTPVSLVYNGNGYFDTVALVSWGEDKSRDRRVKFRKALLAGEADEEAAKDRVRFGSPGENSTVGGTANRPWMPSNLGVYIISCDDGDIRMSADGMYIYDNEGMREVVVPQPGGAGMNLDSEVLELYDAVRNEKPLFHDGRWGMATAEVQWAIIESSKQRREIMLVHQVPVPPGF